MKFQLFTLLVAAVAYANVMYRPAAEAETVAEPVDFALLHSQAASALQALQRAKAADPAVFYP